jgi:hypothetical protein
MNFAASSPELGEAPRGAGHRVADEERGLLALLEAGERGLPA